MYCLSVIGAGSYGTALAVSLSRNGAHVLLWGRDHTKIEKLQKERCNNEFLPGISFPDTLDVSSDIAKAVSETNLVLVVVPSRAFRGVLQQIKPYFTKSHRLVWATKGLESGTGRLLSDVALEILGNVPMAVISGPTFAGELAKGMPTAVAAAGNSTEFVNELSKIIHTSINFRVYLNPDFIGVQIGGTVKNVIAIGAGISDGLGFGANARTALITRGLVEMERLGTSMGASARTFFGMAGLGDLVLTCTDNQSRNRRFGLSVGKGVLVQDALKQIGQAVEGLYNTKEVHELAQKYHVDMPICEEVYQILFKGKSALDATKTLLSRSTKEE